MHNKEITFFMYNCYSAKQRLPFIPLPMWPVFAHSSSSPVSAPRSKSQTVLTAVIVGLMVASLAVSGLLKR